ncbi:hypothetical protein ACNKHW_10050 [Shigella flexneri]
MFASDPSPYRSTGGCGLGLAIVQSIARQWAGRLIVTPANWVVLASRLAGRYGIHPAIYLCLTLRARWSVTTTVL